MDADGVLEKFGVTPAQIVDFLALTGDKADNIPGSGEMRAQNRRQVAERVAGSGGRDGQCSRYEREDR